MIYFPETLESENQRYQRKDETEVNVPYIYRVLQVPSTHEDVSSPIDQITVQRMIKKKWLDQWNVNRRDEFFFCNVKGEEMALTANTITFVGEKEYVEVTQSKLASNRKREKKDEHICAIDMDFEAYLKTINFMQDVEDSEEENENDEHEENEVDSPEDVVEVPDVQIVNPGEEDEEDEIVISDSLQSVFKNSPSVLKAKSMVQKIIEKRKGILLMSPKYHCECAGVGIENCFGRCKYWYKRFHVHSTDGLRVASSNGAPDAANNIIGGCFHKSVVTLHQCRKYARKARDYMRSYRAGATGLKFGQDIKLLKTHRNALDTDLAFVSANCLEDSVNYTVVLE